MARRHLATLVFSSLLLAAPAIAAQCTAPKPVRNYLKSHPSWSVVDVADLNATDKLAWRRIHRGLCPGIAIVELARGEKSYALAATNKGKDGRMERLILLQADGKKLSPRTLVPAFAVGDPIVVWRAKARSISEFGSKRKIAFPHDSIIFEKMGMSSKVFYLADGKIHTVLKAD